MMNGLQSIPQWDDYFHHPRGGTLGLLTAIQNVGSLVGLPFAPRMLDTYGRRRSILVGVVIMCVATVAQTAAWSVGVFVAAR
jgi:MFS family permease